MTERVDAPERDPEAEAPMSEREKLIEAIARTVFNSFFEDYLGDFDRANEDWQEQARREARTSLDAIHAAGYRLVATEGPEFEAIETAIRILKPIADDMEKVSHRPDYRYRTSSGGRACLDAYRVLRAALETGERDG